MRSDFKHFQAYEKELSSRRTPQQNIQNAARTPARQTASLFTDVQHETRLLLLISILFFPAFSSMKTAEIKI